MDRFWALLATSHWLIATAYMQIHMIEHRKIIENKTEHRGTMWR